MAAGGPEREDTRNRTFWNWGEGPAARERGSVQLECSHLATSHGTSGGPFPADVPFPARVSGSQQAQLTTRRAIEPQTVTERKHGSSV